MNAVPDWVARSLADRAQVAAELRTWARGLYALEAAAELLIRAQSGRFLHGPWIRRDKHGTWIDPSGVDRAGFLSGGERRLLDIALSLATDNRPVSLNDALPGLDRRALSLVLAAVAHAGGSHEQSVLVDVEPLAFDQPGALYPWPDNSDPNGEDR